MGIYSDFLRYQSFLSDVYFSESSSMFFKNGLRIPRVRITRKVWSNKDSQNLLSDLLIQHLWYSGPGNLHFKDQTRLVVCTPQVARINL